MRLISASARSRIAPTACSAVSRTDFTALETSLEVPRAAPRVRRALCCAELRFRVAAAFFADALRCAFVWGIVGLLARVLSRRVPGGEAKKQVLTDSPRGRRSARASCRRLAGAQR